MDGIHDLGGMQGFGCVGAEADEPIFHAPWEERVFALSLAAPFALGFGDDQFRPAIEAIVPERYLASSYYEKWLTALEAIIAERGVLSPLSNVKPVPAAEVESAVFAGYSQSRPEAEGAARRFGVGHPVRTHTFMHSGHNRLPRYARGKLGKIESVHGPFLVADRNSIGDVTPDTLYTVVFDCVDLFGPDAPPGDKLSLDLWDCYLEPAL